jgi:hypothetical protein
VKAFQQIQQQFIAHIKDPKNQPPVAGIEDRRLAIYRELFFNNVHSFVSTGFPVLKSLYEDRTWTDIVRDFFIKHDCHSPYFADISKEFVDYLVVERDIKPSDPPFLIELAHYEWVELDVSIRVEQYGYHRLEEVDLADADLVLSETAWPLSYSFAVHQISTDFIPTEGAPGSVHLIVYRDDEEHVQFMLINGVTAMLMQLLSENPGATMDALVQALVSGLPQFSAQQITDGALDVMHKLIHRGIIRSFHAEDG